MHKRVLPSQRMAGRPPGPSIRVVRFGDQHRAESIRAVLAQEQVQFIQALEVKDQRAVGAVDLEAEEILAPGAKRAGLQRADRAAAELQHRFDRILDVDSPHTAFVARTAINEDARGGGDRSDFADERSEEHTSELQSRGHLVCRLLLEKKTEVAA